MIATCHMTRRVIPEPTVAGTECGLQATPFRYSSEHVRAVSMRAAIGILKGGCRTVIGSGSQRTRFAGVFEPPSSRGPGHHPFKVKIAGSNPAGGTKSSSGRSFDLPVSVCGSTSSPAPLRRVTEPEKGHLR